MSTKVASAQDKDLAALQGGFSVRRAGALHPARARLQGQAKTGDGPCSRQPCWPTRRGEACAARAACGPCSWAARRARRTGPGLEQRVETLGVVMSVGGYLPYMQGGVLSVFEAHAFIVLCVTSERPRAACLWKQGYNLVLR